MPPSRSQKQPAVAPQSRPRTRRQVAAAQLAVKSSPDAVDKPAENQGQMDDLQTPKIEADKASSDAASEDWLTDSLDRFEDQILSHLKQRLEVEGNRDQRMVGQYLNSIRSEGRYCPLPNDAGQSCPPGYAYGPNGMSQQRIMHMSNAEVEAWLTHYGKPGAASADETTRSKRERLVVAFTIPTY
ncbi:hypothetical protein JCM10213_007672 [Rhodosporidiobolus nylandii]